ncbi:MAG: response regulator [Polyangiaceae bacterium]
MSRFEKLDRGPFTPQRVPEVAWEEGLYMGTLEVETDRLRFLFTITTALAEATTEYERVLEAVVEQTAKFLDACVVLGLLSEDRASWRPVAQFAEDDAVRSALRRLLARGSFPMNDVVLARIARVGQPTVWHAPFPDALRSRMTAEVLTTIEQIKARSVAVMALGAGDNVIGTLTVLRTGEGAPVFDDAELDLLGGLAGHAAQAVANARLVEAVRRELEDHARTREALAQSEEKTRHLQRIEAAGRLAGGVAHDFNNLLSVIMSYADMVHEDLPEEHEMRAAAQEILVASRRGAEVTRQLLAFSRQQVLQPREIVLNRVVAGIEKMLQWLLGEDIDVRARLQRDLAACKVDPSQMEQVLLQLVLNARDAMPLGGRLTIETSNVDVDEAYVAEHPEATAGRYVQLAVSDSGVGMDESTKIRIFEPFFSTKPSSPGSGLGLSAAYGVVQQSGGFFVVESEVGHGTTMRVLLPSIERPPSIRGEGTTGSRSSLPLSSAVLVVEPDPHVRHLLREILERAGHKVHVVEGAGEAILLAQQRTTDVALLVCDLQLPDISGRALAKRLREAWPEMRVLFLTSGVASSDARAEDFAAHVVSKPITPDAFLASVHDLFSV